MLQLTCFTHNGGLAVTVRLAGLDALLREEGTFDLLLLDLQLTGLNGLDGIELLTAARRRR